MSAKKASKKSLTYVRPQPGTFTLEAFPGIEFRFRKVTVDDEAWCEETLGKTPWAVLLQKKEQSAVLCRMLFHFLHEDDKGHFTPIEEEKLDYDTGKTEVRLVAGYKRFMRSIDGGSPTEIILITQAFTKTLLASKPIDTLPDDLKKSLLTHLQSIELDPKPSDPVTAPNP
jgi:hypothetical protein